MQVRLLTGARLLLATALLAGCQKAALNAPPSATITLSATPTVIPESGGSATVQAVVRLETGELVPDGVVVSFFTTLGAIDPQAKTEAGVATVTLESTGTAGLATVSALSGGTKVATVQVTFGQPAALVQVSFEPASLPTGGGSATVRVKVTDASGAPLAGKLLTLAATAGATLQSAGSPIVTDATGTATDTVTTTATTTVTATVQGAALTGSRTLPVGGVTAAKIVLFANPASLPSAGGSSLITAFVTDAAASPVAGATVDFSSLLGSVTPASAVTDASGLASTTLATIVTTVVTAKVGTLSASVVVSVGGVGTNPYTIVLSAARTSLTDPTLTRALGCNSPSPNPQLPIPVYATVTDASAQPVAGLDVTLVLEDIAGDLFDARGAFCPGTSAICCPALPACLTPPPGPTPSPTPACCVSLGPACCGASTLPKSQTRPTDAGGVATFDFLIEDTDICECIYAAKTCRAKILSSAPSASSANDLVITFSP